jgi:hypothetical protein
VNPTVLKEFNITSSKVTELTEAYEDYNLWRFDSFKNRFYIFLAYYSKKIKRASGFYKIKILFDKSRLD